MSRKRPTRRATRTRTAAAGAHPPLRLSLSTQRSRLVDDAAGARFRRTGPAGGAAAGAQDRLPAKQGESRYERTLALPASRGKILDRNGEVLASSLPARSVWAVPGKFAADAQQRRSLARLLDMSQAEIQDKLATQRNFVYLARQVEPAVAVRVEALGIDGLHQDNEYKRHYPHGPALAHLIGYTSFSDVGQEGIELARNRALAGQAGERRVIRDLSRRNIEDVGEVQPPVDGQDVHLSIDSRIQYHVFNALADAVRDFRARSASAVVVDARTGEILAMANWPSFDPVRREHFNGPNTRNRAIADRFEPGSTIKPFTAALALERRRVGPRTVIDTSPGRIKIGSHWIHDAHRHGELTVEQVIQKSSNIGTVRMAQQLKPREMWSFFDSLGFGHAPRTGLGGATAGVLRDYKRWRPVEQATMSYGHGLSVSLLQLAGAYTVFARGGERIPLTIWRRDEPVAGERLFSGRTASAMLRMLEMAAGPDGTAPKAQVAGYRVAGKTGTAHKIENGRYVKKYVAAFAGVAPASNPRVVAAVMVDEPRGRSYYGGDVAAPVFSRIVAETMRVLHLPPDAELAEIRIPGNPVKESL
ncbi:MAG: penicillin-binding protein 2 [Burkholderiaceae bacterium]